MPVEVSLTVNGEEWTGTVEPRKLLSDFLREDLSITGTHVGCEHGVCGACTILMDGRSTRACLTFAVQADGADIVTVEGLSENGDLNSLQQAFWEHHGLQCGFCTPGMLIAASELLEREPDPSTDQIKEALSGVLCRCTGYRQIIDAVEAAAGNGTGVDSAAKGSSSES